MVATILYITFAVIVVVQLRGTYSQWRDQVEQDRVSVKPHTSESK